MPVVRWEFYDPVTTDTYEFLMNPSEGGSPGYSKSITFSNTSAPGGKVLAFEGRDNVRELEISGVLKEASQLAAFETWFLKRNQIRVTDDLGRQFMVYITDFTPTRRRAVMTPYKHDYTMRMFILDWV